MAFRAQASPLVLDSFALPFSAVSPPTLTICAPRGLQTQDLALFLYHFITTNPLPSIPVFRKILRQPTCPLRLLPTAQPPQPSTQLQPVFAPPFAHSTDTFAEAAKSARPNQAPPSTAAYQPATIAAPLPPGLAPSRSILPQMALRQVKAKTASVTLLLALQSINWIQKSSSHSTVGPT